ncbi:MAG: protein phosphatase 2C domain-containing protein [Promethearchaeota archaeon]
MTPQSKIREKNVLLGKNHIISEKSHIEEFSAGAIGISIGPKQRHWHLELNEDAGMVLTFEDKILVAVCDGHHGAQSSEVVIETLHKNYHRFNACETQDQFNSIAESLITESYQIIIDKKSKEDYPFPRTATTVTMALITPSTIYWANMGDSALIYQDGVHKPKMLNELHSQAFVGWKPSQLHGFSIEVNVSKRLKKGKISRKEVSQLIFTTDGILDYYPGGLVTLFKDMQSLAHEKPVDILRYLFQNVFKQELGDNLCAGIINLER